MNNVNFTYTNLTPFKWYVLENFPFIEADFDALTNWQLFCKLGKEINKIIPAVNKVGQQTEDLTNFVTNYFNNLDVQEEINNKLDQMAQDGTLEEIISHYINLKSVLSFDTVNDMKNASNLIDGSFARTNGYHNLNDGGSGFYKIRTLTSEDTIDEMFILSVDFSETLVAELIYNDINIKQLGAKGDGLEDETLIFQKACLLENKTIYIPTGKYLISNSINMAVGNKVIGYENAIITTNTLSINIFNVNRYCNIKGLDFELPKGYFGNVFEISYRTIDAQPTPNVYNCANINIKDIRFLFDLDINDIANKKGNCFLITADNTESNIKYNGSGFWGINIDNIFVKGACKAVIQQYRKSPNWITGCYYTNFNIDSAPLYGYLGFKDISNPDLTYFDGKMIYFDKWQMQCGKSINMFAFREAYKFITNSTPWDWAYAVNPSTDKPISILYNETITGLIYVDGIYGGNLYNLTQIINKPDDINFWYYVGQIYSHFNDLGVSVNHSIYQGHYISLTKDNTTVQNLTKEQYQEVIWQKDSLDNNINLGLTRQDNSVLVGKGINTVLINLSLNVSLPTDGMIVQVNKNNTPVIQQSILQGEISINLSNVIAVENGDLINVKVYSHGDNGQILQYQAPFNEFKVTALS